MAIVKFQTPIAGLRGTIGGVTYSASKSGPWARQWSRSSNPRTQNQQAQRAIIAAMSGLWRSLTAAQKTAWDTFAALPAQDLVNSLGETYSASGFAWFTKCNTRLTRTGRSTITATPTQARPAAPTIDDFRVTVAGSETTLTSGGTPSSSSNNPGRGPQFAFDGDVTGTSRWQTLSPAATGWLRYDLSAPAQVLRYRLYPPVLIMTAAPKDWTFEVFTSGAWQVLQTVTGANLNVAQWYTFDTPNPFTETNYRINITANNGFPGALAIQEMEMLVGLEGASTIIYPDGEFLDTPDYDLVLHVSMANSTGTQIQYPGFTEILATQSPGNNATAFQSEIEGKFGTIIDQRAWYSQLYRQTQEGIRSAAATARAETT